MNFDENTKRLKQCQAVNTIIHSNRLFEKFNKKDVHNKQSNFASDFLKITEMWVRTLLFSGRELYGRNSPVIEPFYLGPRQWKISFRLFI